MIKPWSANLQQNVANMILSFNLRNRNNLNKFWVGIFTRRVTASKFTKRYGVSELVSDKHSQWSDSGPIITIWSNSQLKTKECWNKWLVKRKAKKKSVVLLDAIRNQSLLSCWLNSNDCPPLVGDSVTLSYFVDLTGVTLSDEDGYSNASWCSYVAIGQCC